MILVDRMSGPGSDTTCTLTNLSRRGIYVECVFAVVFREGRKHAALVTDDSGISSIDSGERQIVSTTRQGPVASGELIAIGRFSELAALALGEEEPPRLGRLSALEIRIVATMGSEERAFGARKRFEIVTTDGRVEAKAKVGTEQLQSRRDRKAIARWIECGGAA